MSVTYTSINQLLASPFQRLTSAMWNTAALTLIQLYQTGGNAVTSVLQNGNLYLPGNLSAVTGNFLYEVYVQGQPILTEQDPIYIAGFISLASSQIEQIIASQQQLYSQLVYIPEDIYTNFVNVLIPAIYDSVARATVTQTVPAQLLQLPYQIYDAITTSPLLKLPTEIYKAVTVLPTTYLSDVIYNTLISFLAYFYAQTVAFANVVNRLTLYLAPPTVEGLQLSVSTTPAPLYNGPSIETLKVILQNLSNYIVYLGNSLYNQFPLLPNSSIEFHVSNPANIYAWATGPATVYALFEVAKQS